MDEISVTKKIFESKAVGRKSGKAKTETAGRWRE
jgi:hypothetical protein